MAKGHGRVVTGTLVQTENGWVVVGEAAERGRVTKLIGPARYEDLEEYVVRAYAGKRGNARSFNLEGRVVSITIFSEFVYSHFGLGDRGAATRNPFVNSILLEKDEALRMRQFLGRGPRTGQASGNHTAAETVFA